MRESEFYSALDWVFPSQGRSLIQDLVLYSLGEQTPQEALNAGMDPQRVWDALIRAMDMPEKYRFAHRVKPDDRQAWQA
ncbi:MAG: DUF3046 domain-containing protein [Actinomycetaceae bacterium]|nr:DUF3046 domain-containing protein [Actinomycetaceae bacterium]MDY6083012.1 DUF3046 domain-containing protein [Actinomycetaceae bacterium]